jgi:hypothetical protein
MLEFVPLPFMPPLVEGMVIDPAAQPFAEFYCVGQGWRFNGVP